VPVKVTINGYTWRSTVGNRRGQQYIVVNAEARRTAGVKAGDLVTITLEPDTEKREIEVPLPLQRALGTKLTQKLNGLSFTHKKEFIVWYSEAKKDDTRARRVQKMRQMLSAGKVIADMKNDLAVVLAAMLGKIPGVVVGKKFNSFNFTVRKKVFAFTKDGGVVLKRLPETVKALLKTRTASLLVMGKRTMKEWVVIRYQDAADARKHLSPPKEAMDYVAEKTQG
jgi:Bacteriocin-protection, YdeI or OmpD-Associated/Domain of unknown function (DUF1905)